jgi:hypothetical protein
MGLMPEQNRAGRMPSKIILVKIILVKIIYVRLLLYSGFRGAGRIAAGASGGESGATGVFSGDS